MTYVSSTPSAGTYDPGTGVWSIGSLAKDALVTLTIQATVDGTGTITNTAAVSALDQSDTDLTNNNAQAALSVPSLDVDKVASTAGPVQANDVITYTVSITNTGSAAQDDIVVDDVIGPGVAYVPESTVVNGFERISSPTTQSFSTAVGGVIDGTTTCANPLVRSITVTSDILITDVDFGLNALHTWRGDIQVEVQSPQGTRQLVIATNGPDDNDNYSVLIDDASVNPLNDGDADTVTAGSYIRTAPSSTLGMASWNGESALGLWQIFICDTFSTSDDGTFVDAQLTISGDELLLSPLVRDNDSTNGTASDLTDGSIPSLVSAPDGFTLGPGDTMTVTYDVVVLPGVRQPLTVGFQTNEIERLLLVGEEGKL